MQVAIPVSFSSFSDKTNVRYHSQLSPSLLSLPSKERCCCDHDFFNLLTTSITGDILV